MPPATTTQRSSLVRVITSRLVHARSAIEATVAGLVILWIILSPRGSPVGLATLCFVALAGAHGMGRARAGLFPIHPVTVSVFILASLAALSEAWTLAPAHAWLDALGLALVALLTQIAIRTGATFSEAELESIGAGFVLAMICGGTLLSIEMLTDQALSRTVFNAWPQLQTGYSKHLQVVDGQVVAITTAQLNRRVALHTVLLWPAAAATAYCLKGTWRNAAGAALFVNFAIMMVATEHQSSQLAVTMGLVTFGLYRVSRPAARIGLITGWIAAIAFVLPLATLTYSGGLHKAQWIPFSARERVVFWAYAADKFAGRPLLGIGADATRGLDAGAVPGVPQRSPLADGGEPRSGPHAHNFYIQVWYELGAVGALAFLAIGLTFLATIFALPPSAESMAGALFATIAGMIATSYGLWQFWIQAAIATAVVLLAWFVCAVKGAEKGSTSPNLRQPAFT